MPSSIPIVRQIAWLSLVPQLLIIAVLMWFAYLVNQEQFFIIGAVAYLLISITLRKLIARYHRSGIAKVRQKLFKEAIPCFERSYNFFSCYPWLDKYRYIFLLSSSRSSYKEMALLNIAFCYSQIGEGLRSKEVYNQVLSEFPGSEMAASALRMLESVKY
jgi:hypothetical protein